MVFLKLPAYSCPKKTASRSVGQSRDAKESNYDSLAAFGRQLQPKEFEWTQSTCSELAHLLNCMLTRILGLCSEPKPKRSKYRSYSRAFRARQVVLSKPRGQATSQGPGSESIRFHAFCSFFGRLCILWKLSFQPFHCCQGSNCSMPNYHYLKARQRHGSLIVTARILLLSTDLS